MNLRSSFNRIPTRTAENLSEMESSWEGRDEIQVNPEGKYVTYQKNQ